MYKILLVEDDSLLRESIVAIFDPRLYQILETGNGIEGYQLALKSKPDLIILDLMLPGKSGFLIAKQLRSNKIEAPILMMSTKRELEDVLTGFSCGTDAYIYKPLNLRELLCRAQALLKRPPTTRNNEIPCGEATIDTGSGLVFRGKKSLELPKKQFEILRYICEHRGTLVTKDDLMNSLWDYDTDTLPNTIDVHISKIRKKLRSALDMTEVPIKTMHSRGFILES